MYLYRSWVAIVSLIAGLLLIPAGFAQDTTTELNDRSTNWSGTPDDYQEPWKESDLLLPVVPLAENLTILTSDRLLDDYEYVIDRNSVSLQSDQVFRYTVVIRTPTGVSNGFYEGIHCDTRSVYPPGDYAKVGEGLGGYTERVEKAADLKPAFERGIAQTRAGRAVLLEIITREELHFAN